MASARSERVKLIESLVKKTHFDYEEVSHLLALYDSITRTGQNKVDRNTMREIMHLSFAMTDDLLADRIFHAFATNHENWLNEQEWVLGMSIFLRGTLEEKIKFCFSAYELNGDGFITREEMFLLLKPTMVKPQSEEDRDESIKDLVDLVIKKMDEDHDGRMSPLDYAAAVRKDPLLLEVFGQCVPDRKHAEGFLSAATLDLYANYH